VAIEFRVVNDDYIFDFSARKQRFIYLFSILKIFFHFFNFNFYEIFFIN